MKKEVSAMTTKQILAAVLAGMMLLPSLASCEKTEQGPEKTKRTNVYRGTDIALPEGVDYVENMMVGGDKIYVVYSKEVERPYDPEIDGALYPEEAVPYDSVVTNGVFQGAVALPVAPTVDEVEVDVEAELETEEADKVVTDANGDGIMDDDIAEDFIVEEPMDVYYDYVSCVYVTDLNGENGAEYELPDTGNAYISNMSVDAEGTLWLLQTEWWSNEDYTESKNLYCVYPYDPATGEAKYNLDLNIIIEESGLINEGDYYYVNRFYVDNNGLLHIALENGIITCNAETGEVVGKCPVTDGWVSGMMISGNDIYVNIYPNNGVAALHRYDPTAGTVTKLESGTLAERTQNMYNSDGVYPEGKLYFRDGNGISVYDIATDTFSELINYINCDIDSSNMNNVSYTADGRLVTSYTDWNSGEPKSYCTIYERIPDEEMAEEVIITLASTYNNYQVRRAIIRFNKRNSGVRVAMNTYESYNNQENDWMGGVTQLNADLVSGKVPDILVIDTALPAESYFRQNMFADLNPYIDGENGMDRANLLDNVLRASESNGKLYSIIPSFYLYTLAAKSEHVGTEAGWTLEEMMNTINSMPEDMKAFYEYSRSQVIDNLFTYSMDSFINWETGETYFDTEGFIDFIEYLKTLPEKGYWESYYEGNQEYNYEMEMQMQEDFELRFFKNKALFSMQYVSSFSAYTNAIRSLASDEITLIGYPTREEGSNGATIIPELELAICSASKCKDEAWDFIMYLLADEEYLENIYSFTLNKDGLEKLKEQAEAENEYYYEMTEEDYQWYYENYSEEYVNYLKSNQRRYTSEDGEKIMELLGSVTRIARTDSKVLDIVKDELSGFFGGTKTAEQTANVINSRVRTYVSENS